MKKIILSLLMTLLPLIAFADPIEIEGIYYNLVPKAQQAEVAQSPKKYSGNIIIPESISFKDITYNVTSIGESAFSNCSKLTSIAIPNSVINIGECAFFGCSSLTSLTIPNSVTSVGRSAFHKCVGLTSINIPNGVTSIDQHTFRECSSLTSLTIPNSVTNIAQYAFADCSGLNSIYIPNSVTTIRYGAFQGCSSLTSVIIGSGIKGINNLAFANCIELTDVYCYAESVPTTISDAFNNSFIDHATLHVLETSISSYRVVEPWKNFKSIVIALPLHTLSYIIDDVVYKSYQIEEDKIITQESAPTKEGYTFSGWSEIPATMPAHDVTVTGTFAVNKYKLIYNVDGIEYKYSEIEYGKAITPETAPTKEGYTFSGWSEIPETMPAHDVTIAGTFSINKYNLIYRVDDEVYKFFDVEYGAIITPETEPTKEGYIFSGWSMIPETMPAHDVTVTGSFTKGAYKLTYTVDGEVYKTLSYDYGSTVTPETAPTKEGYTFSGWSEIPEMMPAHDVTITGTFTINKYKLTYKVDDEVYKSYDVEYGATITPEAEPTKEGYTFSCWSEIPETMPAKDVTVTGTFTINKYKLTYKVDGEVYKSYDVEYGATITPEVDPTKEGYTFSGWSMIPESMPAHDVTVTGSFTKGAYKLTYMVDGEVYKALSYDYGSTITPEPTPTKEGYTFSGWSEIPETMPAENVTVTGTFAINKYKLTYKVDDEVYKTYDIDYSTSITPETAPTKEGYTFSGWSEIPEMMPAHDVTITGTFAINQYTITYKIDDEVYQTESVDYGSTITPPNAPEREGYTFEWIDVPEAMPAHDITIIGSYTSGINAFHMEAENGKVFDLNGRQIKTPGKGVYIINGKKVVVK